MCAQPADATLLSLLESLAAARRERGHAGLAAVETTLAAGLMPPLHQHGEDEAVHVLEGRLTLYAGAETIALSAGDSLLVDRGVPHTYRAASETARLLLITFAPSPGRYEDFVRAAGPPAPGGWAALPAPEDEGALAALAAPAGVTVLGPPGALPTGVSAVSHAA